MARPWKRLFTRQHRTANQDPAAERPSHPDDLWAPGDEAARQEASDAAAEFVADAVDGYDGEPPEQSGDPFSEWENQDVELPAERREARHLRRLAAAVLIPTGIAAATIGTVFAVGFDTLTGVVAPLAAITLLRASDVMLGTARTSLIVGGYTAASAAVAFVEAGVWLSATGIVLADLSVARGVAFAAGVALGTAAGVTLIRWLRIGLVTVRLFVPAGDGRGLAGYAAAEVLRSMGAGATVFDGYGRDGPVSMILSVARRKEAQTLVDAVTRFDPQVFATIDNTPAAAGALPRAGRV